MYGAIENLSKKKLIQSLPSDDPRRKTYIISDLGKKVLHADYNRMCQMITITEKVVEEGFFDEKI